MYENQINQSIDPFRTAQIAQKMAEVQKLYQPNTLGGEPMRMPELMREAERVEMLLGQLAQLAGQLDSRLTPILRCPVPEPISNQGARQSTQSPFAGRIAEMADRLEGTLAVLGDLINRLEV